MISAKFITLEPESIQICDCNARVSVLKIFRTAVFMWGIYEVVTLGWGNRSPASCTSCNLRDMLQNAMLAPLWWCYNPLGVFLQRWLPLPITVGEVMKSLACSGWEGKRLCRCRFPCGQGRDAHWSTRVGFRERALVAQSPPPPLHLCVTPGPAPGHRTFQNPL